MLKKSKSLLVGILFCLFLTGSGLAQTAASEGSFNQGIALMREGKFEAALAAFRKSAQLDQGSAAARHNAGLALIFLQRLSEAVVEFKEAVRLAPADAKMRLSLCQALSDGKNYPEAIDQCRETIRLDPSLSEAHSALAYALYRSKKIDDSFTTLQNALAKFRNDERLLNLAGELYLDAGQFGEALQYYEILAGIYPEKIYYQIRLAHCYLRTERDSEAVAAANKVIQAEPQNSEAYLILGRVYSEIGFSEEALAAFQKAWELNKNNAEAFYYLGTVQERLGKRAEAITSLRTAVRLFPDSFAYNLELGKILNGSGKFEEAIAPLRKAESLDQRDFYTKISLGLALMESAHFDEALEVINKADQMKPNQQIVIMYLDVIKGRSNAVTQIDYYKKRIADDPTLVNSRLNLASIYGFLRRPAEGEPLFLEAIKLQPNDGQLYNLLGIFYSDSGQLEKAAAAYAKATEFLKHHVLYLSLAGALEKLGRNDEAKAAYQKALAIKADSFAVLKLYADLLNNTGNRQEAIRTYQQALSIEPLNSAALINLGILYIKTNNIESAKQCYELLKRADPLEAKKLARCLRFKAWL